MWWNGRHVSLRGWCQQWCGGSNPPIRTIFKGFIAVENINCVIFGVDIQVKLLQKINDRVSSQKYMKPISIKVLGFFYAC